MNIVFILNIFGSQNSKLDSGLPGTMNHSFAVSGVPGTRTLDFSIFHINNSLIIIIFNSDFKLIKHHYFV